MTALRRSSRTSDLSSSPPSLRTMFLSEKTVPNTSFASSSALNAGRPLPLTAPFATKAESEGGREVLLPAEEGRWSHRRLYMHSAVEEQSGSEIGWPARTNITMAVKDVERVDYHDGSLVPKSDDATDGSCTERRCCAEQSEVDRFHGGWGGSSKFSSHGSSDPEIAGWLSLRPFSLVPMLWH